MLSLEPGRFQRRQRPLDQPVAQGQAGWSRGASGRQRPPPGISGTALWALFGPGDLTWMSHTASPPGPWQLPFPRDRKLHQPGVQLTSALAP